MDVDAITGPALASPSADTIAVGLLDGETDALDGARRCARCWIAARRSPTFRHLAVAHTGEARVIVIGLGAAADLDTSALRIAAALVRDRAAELGSSHSVLGAARRRRGQSWPRRSSTGTILGAYRFDRFKPSEAPVVPLRG